MRYKRINGFTLIELMVTTVIVMILSMVALPAWTSMVESNTVSVATNQLQGIYQLARSEALKLNASTTLTSSNSLQTWTIADSAGTTIKTATLPTSGNLLINNTTSPGGEVTMTISSIGFTTGQTITLSAGSESKVITILSSGQITVS